MKGPYARQVPALRTTSTCQHSRAWFTPGFSGADLANLVNEAALIAARRGKTSVEMDDFEYAKDKVLMGVERKSMVLSEEEKEVTAYHEAGHALVAVLTPNADPLHKVTIIPRGRALGVTQQMPLDDRHNYSLPYLETQVKILLGGRIAEEIVLGEKTTGAGNDLERVTDLARRMVTEWGMSDRVGPLTFGSGGGEIFLGRDFAQQNEYSEGTARLIDEEIKHIIDSAYKATTELLEERQDALHAIAKALLTREVLTGDQIQTLVEGRPLEEQDPGPSEPTSPEPAAEADGEPQLGMPAQPAEGFTG